jgi:hypothetical protein
VNGLAGAVVWAVVPYVPEAPFRLYAGQREKPVEVSQATQLIAAARKGSDAEFTFLVAAKARPVLVVSDRIDPRLREGLALRLVRLSTLDPHERETVHTGGDPGLVPLPPDQFDLPDENAVMIAALVRVHESAIDPHPLGRVDEAGLRDIHERIARHYGLDLHGLVRAQLQRIAEAQQRRSE